jgi:hypothetical protein
MRKPLYFKAISAKKLRAKKSRITAAGLGRSIAAPTRIMESLKTHLPTEIGVRRNAVPGFACGKLGNTQLQRIDRLRERPPARTSATSRLDIGMQALN